MAKGILCISNMNIIIIILAITTRLEAVVASQYRAFDGCSKNTQNDFEDLNPGYYHVLSRPAEMVCCSMDGSSCSRKNQGICRSGSGDSYKATWMEANQNCLNSCGTGCNYDNQLVWSNIEQGNIKLYFDNIRFDLIFLNHVMHMNIIFLPNISS